MRVKWPDLKNEDIRWVITPAAVRRFCDEITRISKNRNALLVLDIESTGLNEHHPQARIAMVSFSLGLAGAMPVTYVVPFSHPHCAWSGTWRKVLTQITGSIKDSAIPLSNQNIRFDLRWIYAHTGIDLVDQIVWDTGLSSQLLNENVSVGLKDRAAITFGISNWADVNFSALETEQRREERKTGRPPRYLLSERVDFFQLGLYAARDTYWTWALMMRHDELLNGPMLDEEDPTDRDSLRLGHYLARVGMPSVRSITSMEQRGWLLDRDWTSEKLTECQETARKAYDKLEAMMPGSPEHYEEAFPSPRSYASQSLWFDEWSAAMIREGQLRVTASTPGGQPSWSKAVLVKQARAGSVAAQTILDYRLYERQAQFLQSWLDHAQVSGRIHATYHYYRVTTGRTSCSDPNLQQVTKLLRPAFIADEGHVLIDADLSQIELRVIAYVANCQPMIDAYVQGKDLHAMMAAKILKIPESEVTVEQRQRAKAPNFGFAYLQQAAGFVDYAANTYDVDYTFEEAELARQEYFELWEGIGDWHAQVERDIARSGQIVSPFGRVRRFPGIADYGDYDFGHAVRQAVNSPIQSMASDILQLGVAKIRSEHPWIQVVGMVHDAVIASVPQERAQEGAAVVVRCMTQLDEELLSLGVRLPLPLEATVRISRRWGGEELWTPST